MNYYLHYKKWHDHTKPGYIENSIKKYKELFDGILPESKEARILEIGCANGMALLALKDMGYLNIKGIELSPELATIAKSFNLEVIEADALDYIKKEKQKYDFIFMIDVLEHIPVNRIYEFLCDIYERLNEKGKLMLIIPNAISLAGSYFRYIDWTHQTSFTPTSISYLLENAGFSKTIIKEQVDENPPNPDDFKNLEMYQNALKQYNDKIQYRDFVRWQYSFYFGREAYLFPLTPNMKVISQKNKEEKFNLEIVLPETKQNDFSYIFNQYEEIKKLSDLINERIDLSKQSIDILKDRLKNIDIENLNLKNILNQQLEKSDKLHEVVSHLENRINFLYLQYESQQQKNKLNEHYVETIKKMLLFYSSQKKFKKRVMYYYWSKIIKRSGEFDTLFYLQRYPDVKKSKMDPVKHYILYGADEGRDPSPRFSTLKYMIENPKIIIKGINPLVHYILSNKRKLH